MALVELRGHLAQGVDDAALLIRRGPQLADGLSTSGRAVGYEERRGSQAAVDEVAAEGSQLSYLSREPSARPISTF